MCWNDDLDQPTHFFFKKLRIVKPALELGFVLKPLLVSMNERERKKRSDKEKEKRQSTGLRNV